MNLEANDEGVVVIPIEQLAAELGVTALQSELDASRAILMSLQQQASDLTLLIEQVVDYMNGIDLRLQELSGERIVSVNQRPHVQGAHIAFSTRFPSVPVELLTPDKPGKVAEMVERVKENGSKPNSALRLMPNK